MKGMTYSVDLVLPVLVYPKSSVDTPYTPSSITIGSLWCVRRYVGYDLIIEMVQDLTIGQPNKVPSEDLRFSYHFRKGWSWVYAQML